MGALLLLAMLNAPAVPPPLPVSFSGFVFDPLSDMRRIGVRVLLVKQTDEAGQPSIAVRVYDRQRDAYGDTYWQERTALCRPVSAQPQAYEAPRIPSRDLVIFDRFHPPADNDDEEQQ